jgi:hypothetical protein
MERIRYASVYFKEPFINGHITCNKFIRQKTFILEKNLTLFHNFTVDVYMVHIYVTVDITNMYTVLYVGLFFLHVV